MFYEDVEYGMYPGCSLYFFSVSEMYTHLDNTGAMLIFMLEPEVDVKSSVRLVNTQHILSMQSQSSMEGEEHLSSRRKCWVYLLICFRRVSGELAQNKERLVRWPALVRSERCASRWWMACSIARVIRTLMCCCLNVTRALDS